MAVYWVFDETDSCRPWFQHEANDLEAAKNYVRDIVNPLNKKNKECEDEEDKVRLTLVVRCGRRLMFLGTSEESRLWINKPGGLSIRLGNKHGDDGGQLMIPQPSLGRSGYSDDAAHARYKEQLKGRGK